MMRCPREQLSTLLLATLVAGCGEVAATDDAADRPIALSEEPVYTVGRQEGADWEMFARASAATFDASDNLYVLDTRSFRVVVFDSAGNFLRMFGTRGDGPGELNIPRGLFVTPDGRVAVSDLRHRALVVYDSTGQHLFNVTHGASMSTGAQAAHSDGSTGAFALMTTSTPAGRTADLIHLDLSESPAPEPLHSFRLADLLSFRTELGSVRRTAMWSPEPMIAVLPDGRAVAHYDAEYTLLFIGSDGAIDTVRRAIPATVVTEEVKAAWKQADDSARAARGITRPLPYEMPFADRMSVLSGMLPDPKRGVWVQRRRPDGEPEGPIDVISADGDYLGTLPEQPLPDALSRSGRAAYIVEDSLGVQRVAVKRLVLEGIDG